jgi:MFS family permease
MTVRHRLGALREYNFRLLWIGRTASVLGDSLTFVALAFAVLGLRGSGTDIGLVLASFSAPRVLFLLVGGVWADRLPRRRVMIAADLVRAAAQVGLAAAVLSGTASLAVFMLAAAVTGTASAFFQPASTGIVPEAVSAERLQEGNALLQLSQSVAFLLGPVVSGLLVVAIGPGWIFAIDGVSFLLSAAALAALRLTPAARSAGASFVSELVQGWREVLRRDWLLPSFLTFSFVNLSFAGFLVIGPMAMSAAYRGAADWGLVMSVVGFGGLVGGSLALRWRPSRPLIAVFALLAIHPVSLLVLSGTPLLPIVLVAVLLGSSALTLGDTVWHTTIQQQIPAASLSRVSSYDWMVSFIFFPIGTVLAGPLADALGVSTALLLFAGLSSIPTVLVLLLPAIRAIRRVDQPATVLELAELEQAA